MTTTTPARARHDATTKVLDFADAPAVMDRLRAEGLRIVQCHGTFDLVHPGHIVHFEEARALGDVLVVTITAARFVNKGPGRPYFNDEMRLKALAALSIVDYVVLVPYAAAVEAIECIRPFAYCKGREYANPDHDVTGNIGDDVRTVTALGGTVHYVGADVFSSSQLINRALGAVPKAANDRCRELAQCWTPERFRDAVDEFARLKVLVVGDIIFDRYTYVHVQGLTSKNRTLSARRLSEDTHAGGALAVVRHLAAFAGSVDLVSVAGTEPWVDDLLDTYLPDGSHRIVRSPAFTTVVKQRFVEQEKRSTELSKLFALNVIDGEPPDAKVEADVCAAVHAAIDGYDLVVVADFGHGLMLPRVRALVQEEAPLLALNCQTNSYNHGFNVINRQYQRTDFVSLDEQELMLAIGERHPDFDAGLHALARVLGCRAAWLTRGAEESIGVAPAAGRLWRIAPLETRIVDTVGAGDAFFAGVALAGASGLPIDLATFVGQLAGAQAVRIPGNREPIRKDVLVRSGMNLLNQ
jgi:cytidyltransferase-like protein